MSDLADISEILKITEMSGMPADSVATTVKIVGTPEESPTISVKSPTISVESPTISVESSGFPADNLGISAHSSGTPICKAKHHTKKTAIACIAGNYRQLLILNIILKTNDKVSVNSSHNLLYELSLLRWTSG